MARQAEQPVGDGVRCEVFRYEPVAPPAEGSWEAFESVSGADPVVLPAAAESGADPGNAHEASQAAQESTRADELGKSFEAGRERGFGEGRAAEREAAASAMQAREAARALQIAGLVEGFHGERARYFEAVEHEVVRLAMAVAARILRREAQVDPLLLSGAMRVALGQLSSSTQVSLKVPAADLELWADAIAHMPNLAVRPVVVAGQEMQLGECRLETELGMVDLGFAAQLAEIERGFFDRSSAEPAIHRSQEDMSE